MRLLEASIRGFGRLVERRFVFAAGAVLVVGANESGKSTLQQFLLAMLFGLKREDRRRRDYLPEYERYRPWTGAAYAGRLVYELANGEKFEVHRVFDRRDESVRVLDADAGRERTGELPLDERKERPFMPRHIVDLGTGYPTRPKKRRQLVDVALGLGKEDQSPRFEPGAHLRQRFLHRRGGP